MITKSPSRRPSRTTHRKNGKTRAKKVVNKIIQRDLIHRLSYDEYRDKVCEVYGGPRGAMLAKFSRLSGHLQLGERILRTRKFDLAGARNILDVGCGAGQVAGHLLKYADPSANITATDISSAMLRRARKRLKSPRPEFVTADLAQLPFDDENFDCVTCCYVLEHLPDARTGLSELSRVMVTGARMLLFTTEDNFGGAWTSRMWSCRTYNRRELLRACGQFGLVLEQELWFTRIHQMLRAGGICLALRKVGNRG